MKATLKAQVVQKMEYRSGQRSDGNSWSVQDILVRTVDEQYPKDVVLKFINKPTDPIVEGKIYNFQYEVEARSYNGRWYNDVKCWHYDEVADQPQPQAPAQPQPMTAQNAKDDLPF